jgi:SNF2 family DNA or RNA helicase
MTSELPDLMSAPNLNISLDDDPAKFRVSGGTYMHKDRIASIPGSRFVGGGKDYWTIPRSWAALKVVVRLFPNNITWTSEAVEWANQIWTGLVEPSLSLRNEGAKQEWVDAVAEKLPKGVVPKAYQVAGSFYLATAHRAMLLDEQGTGKMTQTGLTLSLYGVELLPCLIVCPKNVVYTWQRELARFGIESVVVDGGAAERRKQFAEFAASESCKVLIISYGLMLKHSKVEGFGTIKLTEEQKQHKELQETRWVTVVADEAHRLKDPTSVQTRACWAARNGATNVWALTGTPMEKNVLDLWALLHFIDPVEFPSKTKFLDLWVMTAPNYFGGIEILGLRPDTEEEFRSVTEWHWRRVLQGADLPPEVFDVRYCTLEGKHLKAYRDMKKQLMAEVDSDGSYDTLFAENHMVKTGRLKMMASSAIMIDVNDNVRMVEPSWKLDAAQDALKDYGGHAIIYWFDNRDLLHLWEKRLEKAEIGHVSIHGDITGKDRDNAVQAFQRGDVDHILITYGAGSEGITLTRSDVAFRLQRPFSYLKDSQAPFRNRRIGSEVHDQIVYVDFITKDSMEEDQIQRLTEKSAASQEILKDNRD